MRRPCDVHKGYWFSVTYTKATGSVHSPVNQLCRILYNLNLQGYTASLVANKQQVDAIAVLQAAAQRASTAPVGDDDAGPVEVELLRGKLYSRCV